MSLTITEHHGSSLYRHECRACAMVTLHNARGCVHCGTRPSLSPARPEVIYGRGRPRKAPDPSIPAGHKRCTKCKVVRPHEDFGLHLKQTDGRNAWCKPCVRTDAKRKRTAA